MNQPHSRSFSFWTRSFEWADALLLSKSFVWIIILIALMLRSLHYFSNPSLWFDEAALALNIVDKDIRDLMMPLDKGQMAPFGFLITVKLLVESLGNNEYVLRLFPFFCGISSVFLFKYLSDRILRKETSTIALGLFALSTYLIHYSAEVKQYSSDVAIVLSLYAFTLYLIQNGFRAGHILIFGLLGSLSVAFSHPSAIVLSGIGITLLLSSAFNRTWTKMIMLCSVYLFWFFCFLYLTFFVSHEMLAKIESMQHVWRGAFMPLPPTSLSDLKWFGKAFAFTVKYPMGLSFPLFIGLILGTGIFSMFRRNRLWLSFLISPILIVLLLSGFHLYPFAQRMLLFSVPSVIILLAEGVQFVRMKTHRYTPLIGLAALALLFYQPSVNITYNLITGPPYRVHHSEEIRPVMNYVNENRKGGDLLYLYFASKYAFQYYSGRTGLDDMEYVTGRNHRDDWSFFIPEIDRMKGNERVWFLFSHVVNWNQSDKTEESYMINHLDKEGKRLNSLKLRNASVYLYDLSRQ